MAQWTVSTTEKKSCEEREIWTKGDATIGRVNGFRWGTFTVKTTDDNPPDGISEKNNEGVNMYDHGGTNIDSIELISMDDGWYDDYEFNGVDEETEQEILNGIDDADADGIDYSEYLEENGWSKNDTQGWLYGPLEITKDA